MTDLALITSPLSKVTWWMSCSDDSETAFEASMMQAPNFCAWRAAPRGEFLPRQPGREAEVVLDARRHPRLTAEGGVLGQGGRHPLGRAVDRRRQAGGPTADHQEIADFGGAVVAGTGESQRGEQSPAVGISQERTVRGR